MKTLKAANILICEGYSDTTPPIVDSEDSTAKQLFTTTAATVPEPSTWAMALLGFAGSRLDGAISAWAFDLPERPPDRLDGPTVRATFGLSLMKKRTRSMRIRPIAVWLGLGAAQGFVVTAHAEYDPPIVLQNPGGGPVSQPYAINASGLSVGYAETASSGIDAVLWSASGSPTVLDDAGGQGFDVANAINATGQIVGTSETVSLIGEQSVLWSSATPTQAQTLDDAGGTALQRPPRHQRLR